MRKQVFLGGACGTTTWRRDIARPMLDHAGVTYFDPQLGPGEWTEEREPIEMQAKDEAEVLLFVITGETRGVATVAEIAYYMALNRKLALVVNDISGSASAAERDDLNRGRIFVRTMARKHNVPVFATIEEAVQYAIDLVNAQTSGPMSRDRLEAILADIEFKKGRFLLREIDNGFLIQLCCNEADVHSGHPQEFLGRPWYVGNQATPSDVVKTALKAVLTWQEHEAREQFKYRGVQLFSPHVDIETLADHAGAAPHS